jgi:hypothetical protein
MRKLILTAAAAGAALAIASPAAAQYYPAPQPYGYGNYGYGFNGYGNYGQVRALQARIDGVQYQIKRLDRRNVIRDDSADRLKEESNRIEHRLHQAARYGGLNPYEANDISNRISRLEQRVQWAASNRYGRYGYNSGYGYNGYGYSDRDRDGRDDRYENDHGWDHDD